MNLLTNRIFFVLGPLVAILFCVLLYRSCARTGLNVDPHAAKEIERAKQR